MVLVLPDKEFVNVTLYELVIRIRSYYLAKDKVISVKYKTPITKFQGS